MEAPPYAIAGGSACTFLYRANRCASRASRFFFNRLRELHLRHFELLKHFVARYPGHPTACSCHYCSAIER
jgi:hypothetical protein